MHARIAGGASSLLDTAQMTTKAAEAILDVSKTVRMKGIEAPANEKSYVALDSENAGLVDDDGLPLVYSPEAIQTYWKKQGGALQQRWHLVSNYVNDENSFFLVNNSTRAPPLAHTSGSNSTDTRNGYELL